MRHLLFSRWHAFIAIMVYCHPDNPWILLVVYDDIFHKQLGYMGVLNTHITQEMACKMCFKIYLIYNKLEELCHLRSQLHVVLQLLGGLQNLFMEGIQLSTFNI